MKLFSRLVGNEAADIVVLNVDILVIRCKVGEGSDFRQHFLCSGGSNRALDFLFNLIVVTVSNLKASLVDTISHSSDVLLHPLT